MSQSSCANLTSAQRRHVLTSALLAAGAAATLALPNSSRAATPGEDAPPLAQAPRALVFPPLSMQRLANGLELIVAQRPGLPLVTAQLLVRAGAEADPPLRPGVASMTSTLRAMGALRAGKRVDAATLARQAEALGGGLEVASSWGASSVGMTVATPQLPAALALLADVMRHPVLADDELARARAQALDGLRVTLSSPSEVASMALRRSHWGDTPHGRVITPATLQQLQRAELQAFQARWVRPDRAALVLVGDITAPQALALAQRVLGDWAAPAQAAPPTRLAAPAPIPESLVLIDMPGSGQSGVAVAAPFLSSSPADLPQRYAGLVAQAVLGGGYSARLNQEVRIKRGLSYGVSGGPESFAAGGMFSARAQTQHTTAAQVLQLLRAEIARLADAPPDATELAARQATLVGGFARQTETTGGLAGLLAGQWTQHRPMADLALHSPKLLAVTADQVQAFAQRYWRDQPLRAVVAGDLTAAGPSLGENEATTTLRLPVAELDLARDDLRQVGKR